MIPHALRSVLAATDLEPGSDAIVTSAARLAVRFGAELHLLHSLDLPAVPSEHVARRTGFRAQVRAAEARLDEQIGRAVPGGRPTSREVAVHVAREAILERAAQVSADLIVVGRHRGDAGANFLGTTADRVVRTADVPCLVMGAPLRERIRRIGVPIDRFDPSQGALETAMAWALRIGAADADAAADLPQIHVMNAAWFAERHDDPDLEARVIVPELARRVERAVARVPGAERLDVAIEVLWPNDAIDGTLTWADDRDLDLVVMGTHGHRGMKRAVLGSMTSAVARRAARPVLLVPPSLWSGHAHAPRLERVVVATDLGQGALDAARWSAHDLAPGAEQVLVHVLELPEPPAALAGRSGPHDELLRTARTGAEARLGAMRQALVERAPADGGNVRTSVREGQPAEEIVRLAEAVDADLVVVGAGGERDERRGAWAVLGTTVDRVLHASATPVLVVRGAPSRPPRELLVAVDGSAASRRALGWADFLRRRFGARLTAVHVEPPPPFVLEHAGVAMTAVPAVASDAAAAAESADERAAWLREQIDRSGIADGAVSARVRVGAPAAEILAEQARIGADLVVIGTHGRGALGRLLLGSVASRVIRTAPCSVLAVGDPGRRRA